MTLLTSISAAPLTASCVWSHFSTKTTTTNTTIRTRFNPCFASPRSESSSSTSSSHQAKKAVLSSSSNPSPIPPVSSTTSHHEPTYNYAAAATANTGGGSSKFSRFALAAEYNIERVIFDFRFMALLAVGGSLAGSLLCFLNGCVYIVDAYRIYWTGCLKGLHTGQMVLRLVEAIDVYLAGTVMLIFGMGLYGLFISNVPPNIPPSVDRAIKGSSLFGMFALTERPKWMKISSLDELKTKVGHVIVMILLVKMFERSKMVTIATGLDLLSYAVCIFLASASLYILNNLKKSE